MEGKVETAAIFFLLHRSEVWMAGSKTRNATVPVPFTWTPLASSVPTCRQKSGCDERLMYGLIVMAEPGRLGLVVYC